MGREYQPAVLPSFSGQESFLCLALSQLAERFYRQMGKAERPA